ncbi:MAG TPA: cyanophycin synthetase, partial [Dehalococcoidia bacterium]|nr:cyanophycin synthetase [Dehalococcoidia bacterium]
RAFDVASRGLDGLDFTVVCEGDEYRFRTGLAGRHLIGAALPAIGLGRYLGLDWEEIAAGLNDPAAELRLRVVAGAGGSRLLDDSYNASPASVRGALDLLVELSGRKIAVLGDMRELGSAEESAHREIGAYAAARVDRLIVVGNLASVLAEAARRAGHGAVTQAASKDDVVDLLRRELRPGDQVLVKGSRGLELETIVEALREAG